MIYKFDNLAIKEKGTESKYTESKIIKLYTKDSELLQYEKTIVKNTVRFMTDICTVILGLSAWMATMVQLTGGTIFSRLLSYMFQFDEILGAYFGGILLIAVIILLVALITGVFMFIGAKTNKIWKKVITKENADTYRTFGAFVFGVYCCLVVVLVL